MSEGCILAIDCGTQSIRALLIDRHGNIRGKEKVEFAPYFSSAPGWAEQDPEIYWQSLIKACNQLKTVQPQEWDELLGVTVTTQRDTCVNLDRNGNVLRPAIVWLDQRMAKCEQPLPVLDNLAFKLVGMQKTIELSRKESKANWIKENQPEIWNETFKYLLLSGYLTYKLTGNMVDSVACQIGHIPFDYKAKGWPKANNFRWSIFGVEREKLPSLVEPGEVLGQISLHAAELSGIPEGLPVIASGSDKGCETLGMGCLGLETASLSFGTSATVQTTSRAYIEPMQFMPAYPASIPGYYNPEIQIRRGYWMISWFKQEFCHRELLEARERNIAPESLLNERLDEIPPGSDGLLLQPFWGAGLKMPEAKGAIIGFGDVHTRAHIYKAIIEGINYGLLAGLEGLEKRSGTKVQRLMVSGGGSQSDAICQITADMFNRPVYRGTTYEASGLGAAINGFVGVGIYDNYEDAVHNMVHYSQVFEPDDQKASIYRELYARVYTRIYPRLKGLYQEIQKITDTTCLTEP